MQQDFPKLTSNALATQEPPSGTQLPQAVIPDVNLHTQRLPPPMQTIS